MTSGNQPAESILPAPFAWCEIPAGKVRLLPRLDPYSDEEEGEPEIYREAELPTFSIAKYPITNAQFAKFIEAGGYQTERWWTKTGWSLCQEGKRVNNNRKGQTGKPWTEPLFWHNDKWNGADFPVVGISWYEAYAFCAWLSELSGEKIMLPTEFHWERAAAQDDKEYPLTHSWDRIGRIFPWGDEWDGSRCNNNVEGKGIGRTSPVQQYEAVGDSYFGVVDMVGNVWEWCFTKASGPYQLMNTAEGDEPRVARGGSWAEGSFKRKDRWGNETFFLPYQTDFRYEQAADFGDDDIGFRIIRNHAQGSVPLQSAEL